MEQGRFVTEVFKLCEVVIGLVTNSILFGYNMLFRDFFLETASEGLFIAKTASEGNFMPKIVPQTSIYREIFPQKILT